MVVFFGLMARFEPGKIIRTLDETRLAPLLACLFACLLACLLTCLQTFIQAPLKPIHKVRNTCIRAYIHLHIHTSTHSCTHLPIHPSVHTYIQIVSCHSCLVVVTVILRIWMDCLIFWGSFVLTVVLRTKNRGLDRAFWCFPFLCSAWCQKMWLGSRLLLQLLGKTQPIWHQPRTLIGTLYFQSMFWISVRNCSGSKH